MLHVDCFDLATVTRPFGALPATGLVAHFAMLAKDRLVLVNSRLHTLVAT
jgi:hypothetical protein